MFEFITTIWFKIIGVIGSFAVLLGVVKTLLEIEKFRREISQMDKTLSGHADELTDIAERARRYIKFLGILVVLVVIFFFGQSTVLSDKVKLLEVKLEKVIEIPFAAGPTLIQPPTTDNVIKEVDDVLQSTGLRRDSVPTKDQVRTLAEFFHFLQPPEGNRHLQFLEGDISYWAEQKLFAMDIVVQFLARRIVLDAATRSGRNIPSQGDLSALASEVMPRLYNDINYHESQR